MPRRGAPGCAFAHQAPRSRTCADERSRCPRCGRRRRAAPGWPGCRCRSPAPSGGQAHAVRRGSRRSAVPRAMAVAPLDGRPGAAGSGRRASPGLRRRRRRRGRRPGPRPAARAGRRAGPPPPSIAASGTSAATSAEQRHPRPRRRAGARVGAGGRADAAQAGQQWSASRRACAGSHRGDGNTDARFSLQYPLSMTRARARGRSTLRVVFRRAHRPARSASRRRRGAPGRGRRGHLGLGARGREHAGLARRRPCATFRAAGGGGARRRPACPRPASTPTARAARSAAGAGPVHISRDLPGRGPLRGHARAGRLPRGARPLRGAHRGGARCGSARAAAREVVAPHQGHLPRLRPGRPARPAPAAAAHAARSSPVGRTWSGRYRAGDLPVTVPQPGAARRRGRGRAGGAAGAG